MQRGHFQHDFVGVNQLQVAAGQAVVRAVDENQLAPDQGLGVGVGQGVEQQRCIAGGGVRVVGRGAVEQLVAEHGTAFVNDGLAPNDGDVSLLFCALGGHRVCGVWITRHGRYLMGGKAAQILGLRPVRLQTPWLTIVPGVRCAPQALKFR